MSSILKNMQEIIIKYAEVLSEILKVDVEIADSNLTRIAGTGKFKHYINKKMENEAYVYTKTLETGEKQVIENPGKHILCSNCPKKNNCDETFEISMPIAIDNEVIGVIGLVCFTEEQRKHIIKNYEVFSTFLEQIADLISSKASEELENFKLKKINKVFKNIIEKIDQGVLVIDENNKIISINNSARKILKLASTPKFIDDLEKRDLKLLNLREYKLSINNKEYILLGEEEKIIKSPNVYNKIFIFTDINTLNEISTSMSNTKEYVNLDHIIGNSDEIKYLKDKIRLIKDSNSTVLILGESGTGKELFARSVHTESQRASKPFVAINCSAIPDTLLESELFGYVNGAFTGADPKGKVGKFELANGGSLFLDEIGDLPLYLQPKLLRVIEDKRVQRLGSNEYIDVDIRIIAATNKDLKQMIKENKFREDLYYRLNVIPMKIPPLRERKEDIEVLSNYFKNKYSKIFNKKNIKIDKEVLEIYKEYPWPGNVRELENSIEYSMNMVKENSYITKEDIIKDIIKHSKEESVKTLNLEELEKQAIIEALEIFGDGKKEKIMASEALGIGIATLYRKINKYDI